MRYLIAIFTMLYYGTAFCGFAESSLECKNEGGRGIKLFSNRDTFFIREAERGCSSVYTYREYLGGVEGFLVSSSPSSDDLGLNAQDMIYFVLSGSEEASYIGDVPASAIELEDGTYQNVVQSGGSIFKSIYKVSSKEVTIVSPSRELIISDSQCIYQEKDSKVCKKMSGSIKRPLCVVNYGGRKVAAGIDECSGMGE